MDDLKKLLDDGHKLIPLRAGQEAKLPREERYAEKDYGLDDLTGNVGMMIPHGLVDVDFDWPTAGQLCEKFLPLSGMMWARNRADSDYSPVTHAVYRCDLPEPVTFRLPKIAGHDLKGPHAHTVLELRTAKETEPYHVMIPPSVHPSGDGLAWVQMDGMAILSPTEIDADDLVRRAGMLAGFCVLARFYPGEGARDDFALALTGAMIRARWDDAQIERFMTVLCQVAGDAELKMRTTKALRSRRRIEAGRPVRGLTAAAKIAGIPWEWVRTAAIWLGWKKGDHGAAIFDTGMVLDTSRQAWAALEDYVIDGEPAVYAHGDALARVDRGGIDLLDRSSLTYELNRCAKWMRKKDDGGWSPTNANRAAVEDMLSARKRDVTVPELVQLSTVPMFTKDGRLLNRNGFDEESGIFLDLDVDVEVPEQPTAKDVRIALRRLWIPVAQFPYVDRSDKAHVLAMMLEPYVRDFFDATPLYFVNKPAAGTGASLLIEAALYPTLGEFPEGETPPRGEEEMKKTLLAKLMSGTRIIYFDNANQLDSAALAAMITTSRFTGRILGRSTMATMPVRCQFVGSGNNTEMSGELYRRFVDIRIDAEMENPEDRGIDHFRIKDLKGWAKEHRHQQVVAALTIIRYWINAGMPAGSGHKASFESWSRVMSGIFEMINVRGFLATPKDRRPVDPETEAIRELLLEWRKARNSNHQRNGAYGTDFSKPVKAKHVLELIEAQQVGIDLGFGEPKQTLAKKLVKHRGRPYEFTTERGHKVTLTLRSRPLNGSLSWWVEEDRMQAGDLPTGDEAHEPPM